MRNTDRLERAFKKLGRTLVDLNAYTAVLLTEDELRQNGFVCVNKAADTWLPKDLYKDRLERARLLARQPERIPLKPISRKEKYLARQRRDL